MSPSDLISITFIKMLKKTGLRPQSQRPPSQLKQIHWVLVIYPVMNPNN